MRRSLIRQEKGFTLLEALLSLFSISLILMATFLIFISVTKGYSVISERTEYLQTHILEDLKPIDLPNSHVLISRLKIEKELATNKE